MAPSLQTISVRAPDTLSGAVEEFLLDMDGINSPQTIHWYKLRLGYLLDFLGDMPISQITIRDLRRYRSYQVSRDERYTSEASARPAVDGGLSPSTIHTYLRAVKTFFAWTLDEGLVDEDPAQRLKLPRLPKPRPQYIQEIDVLRLVDCAASLRDKSLVMFLRATGCRVGGAANLTLDDLDLTHRVATVREKGRGGPKVREVYFTPEVRDMLRLYIETERPYTQSRHVWICKSHGHRAHGSDGGLTTSGIYQAIKRLALQIGMTTGYNPHKFRHTCLKGLLNNGMSIVEVSQIAGHSSVKVTGDIYGIEPVGKLQRDYDRYAYSRDRGERR